MSMKAGDLREAVTIQVATQATNSYGESTATWTNFANRRAAVEGLTASEAMLTQELATIATHTVRFRYVPGLTSGMRIQWTSRTPARTLDIVSITERNNREEHSVICKERVTT
jgi:SPP1 family predicted phage head-tail adaptor